jgi:hypothetical protein
MSERKITRYIPLYRTLFLDLLLNRNTRPLFLSAFLMIASGGPLYHWLEGWAWID